jgi:hypothetical protein
MYNDRSLNAALRLAEKEYTSYIDAHVRNVCKAFEEFGEELCKEAGADYKEVEKAIYEHDESKYDDVEYDAFREHFYPVEGELKGDPSAYDKAWLHHLQHNKHHPEHWCIVNGKNSITILDMPPEDVVHMVCDWQSFYYVGKGSAYDFYYNTDKKEGLLSDNTRELLERLLEIVKPVFEED